MDKYPNSRRYFSGQLWAIRSESLDLMCEVLRMRTSGLILSADEIKSRIGSGRQMQSDASGQIAILPLYGVIDQKVSAMTNISGGTAVNSFMDAFRSAMADDTVSAIVFDVDSPGGSVDGIPEAATEIYNARGKKPIIAVADPCIASAAYWLACAADEIVCMQSGQVGSIGVIAVHDDYSEANAAEGYKPTYITYGQYKGEGNSDAPLSSDAQAYMQAQVDEFGKMFTAFVAKARKVSVDTVRSSFGQGRMLMPKDALTIKMIDSIGTINQTIARLLKPPTNARAQNDFSQMTLRESTDYIIGGVATVTERWKAGIEQEKAKGKKPEDILTTANEESINDLHSTLANATLRLTEKKLEIESLIAETKEQVPLESKEVILDNTAEDMRELLRFQAIRFQSLTGKQLI